MNRRILTIAGILIVGLVATAAGYAVVEHKNPVTELSQIFVPAPQQVFGKNNLLVLVEGLDYDYTEKDEEYSTNSRSDVIWAVNLDFAGKKIYELSIPRDMIATLPNGTQAKINQAQSDGGVKEAKSVISQWLGIPGFDRYAVLRIDATKEFVDAIGGVSVYVKSSNCLRYKTGCTGDTLDYDDTWGHLHIHLKEGLQHLDGERAVAYMRFRHDWCSDPCRIMRQQQVLHALVAKVKGDKVNTFLHIGDMLGVFRKYVQTDFSDPELLSIANYYQGMPDSSVVVAQVPYTDDINLPTYGDSLVPDTVARAHLVATMLTAPPAPVASPDAMALAAIAPGTLRVDVENGSGVSGAARHVATVLRQAGFTIGDVGDADRSDYGTTEIHEHSNVTFAGAKVRSALPQSLRRAVVVPEASATSSPAATATQTSDVTVIVGSDLSRKSAAEALPDHS
ncbi:MAG: LCP family protein [Candidatus Eremiobacteraeota bacterium]|nr:LCP family protein [Candidatus Eremiobacteraeota bacterium]MBV8497684.1 LCP family protein [Candidatus Eremiobacteraeota bacterium]